MQQPNDNEKIIAVKYDDFGSSYSFIFYQCYKLFNYDIDVRKLMCGGDREIICNCERDCCKYDCGRLQTIVIYKNRNIRLVIQQGGNIREMLFKATRKTD